MKKLVFLVAAFLMMAPAHRLLAADPVAASLKPAEQEAVKLLLYSIILSQQTGGIVEVPRHVRDRYNSAGKALGFSIPGGVAAGGTYWAFKESIGEFKSVIEWVTLVVKAVGNASIYAAKQSGKASEAIGLDRAIQSSLDGSEAAYRVVLKPLLTILSQKGVRYVVASGSGAASLGGSSYLIFTGPERAMTHSSARWLFGYNKPLAAQIDTKVNEMANIYELKPAEVVALKKALHGELIRVAVANKFREDVTYNVDLVGVMSANKLISQEQAAAANLLEEIVKASTSVQVSQDEGTRLGSSVAVILATQAILETMIEEGKLSTDSEMRARQLLGNSKRLVKRIGANLSAN